MKLYSLVLVLFLTVLSWTASAQTITNPLPAATLRANDDVIATDSVPYVYSFNASFKDYIIVRLKYKTDILQALNQVVEEHKIKNAVIINGIGSVYEYHVHSVDNATFPSRNIFNKEAKPSDITCLNGFIIEGRVHAHIGLSDSKTAVGGHLEPGTSVFTFCIITIGILDDSISLNRLDDKTWR